MRRIVITDEEKKRYEDRANELQKKALQKKWFRKKNNKSNSSSCPRCNRIFYDSAAQANGHPGHCCKECFLGKYKKRNKKNSIRHRERNYPPVLKKTLRQERRQLRINKPETIDFYNSRDWKELRWKVLRKYDRRCMSCGRSPPAVVIHVDHIKPRSKYPELELDMNNLQLLCADCNIGKCNYSEEDLRPK